MRERTKTKNNNLRKEMEKDSINYERLPADKDISEFLKEDIDTVKKIKLFIEAGEGDVSLELLADYYNGKINFIEGV